MEITQTLNVIMAEQQNNQRGNMVVLQQEPKTGNQCINGFVYFWKMEGRWLAGAISTPLAGWFTTATHRFIIHARNSPQHLKTHKESYTPPTLTNCTRNMVAFFCPSFSHVILKYIMYFITSCLTSFVYGILNGFTSAALSL